MDAKKIKRRRKNKRKWKSRTDWQTAETELLLELWEEKFPLIRCLKRNKHIYQDISKSLTEQGSNKSAVEVKNKLHKLSDKYRVECRNIEKTRRPSTWEHYDKVEDIFHSCEYLNLRESTSLLIELWERKLPQLKSLQNTAQIYTDVAMEMSSHGFTYAPKRIKGKLRQVISKYRSEKVIAETTGKPSSWKHYVQLENMARSYEEIFESLYSTDMAPPAWPRSLTEQLIEMLEERECLWNTACPAYTEREARNAAINEIHTVLVARNNKLTPKCIRDKIQALRSQFRRELRSIDASKGDGGEERTPSMWCFDKLQFLLPNIKVKHMENGVEKEIRYVSTQVLPEKPPPQRAQTIKKILPMLDRILVKRAEAITQTKGGIMLPEKSSVGKVLEGTVVAVGPGARNPQNGDFIPVGVKEGDRVLLPEYGGTKLELEDKKEYLIYREAEILAKLE